eukprot:3613059-Rhodomonas_salina.1
MCCFRALGRTMGMVDAIVDPQDSIQPHIAAYKITTTRQQRRHRRTLQSLLVPRYSPPSSCSSTCTEDSLPMVLVSTTRITSYQPGSRRDGPAPACQ